MFFHFENNFLILVDRLISIFGFVWVVIITFGKLNYFDIIIDIALIYMHVTAISFYNKIWL